MARGPAERISADAVVIGTGAGGGPAAAVLAEAGLEVIVLEAGPRFEARDFVGTTMGTFLKYNLRPHG